MFVCNTSKTDFYGMKNLLFDITYVFSALVLLFSTTGIHLYLFSVYILNTCAPDYPVRAFNGAKKIVFSNVSWMGGSNEFLGIAYLVIGSLCVVMSVVMLIVYAKFKFPDEEWASCHGLQRMYRLDQRFQLSFPSFWPSFDEVIKVRFSPHVKCSNYVFYPGYEDLSPEVQTKSVFNFQRTWCWCYCIDSMQLVS